MFRQGQLAVHGLAILLGRNEAGISNRGKFFLHHAVQIIVWPFYKDWEFSWAQATPSHGEMATRYMYTQH